ncbi:Cell division-associated protein bimb [Ceratocystis lukuohia]|uniref:separase n=1 Tax=Ceratocystis lukuohia TaxID=2019550 RepID=A0ABR4MDP9_9PEZI
MTATSSSKAEQMESVITDLSSAANCSPATLRLLNSLLRPDDSPATKPPSRTTRSDKSATTTSRLKPATSTNTHVLLQSERERFATQITNATLNALKTASPPSPTPADSPDVSLSREKLKENQPPRPASAQAPLSPRRPRALNRVATTIGSVIDNKPTKSPPTTPQSGCMCVVECARVALGILLASRPAGDPGIETAALTFVGRLLALGLYNEALVDLRAFRRRVDMILAKTTKTVMKPLAKDASAVDIVAFNGCEIPVTIKPLVAMAQLHALRLLTMSKKPKLVEAAIPTLKFQEPGSPTQTAASLIMTSPAMASKYIRQLETITKTILALSPSWSSKDDAEALDHLKYPHPTKAFELQCIGLLSAHLVIQYQEQSADYYPKIIVPLSKVFSALKRRGELEEGAYNAASSYYKMFQTELEPKMGKWPGPEDPCIMSMHLTLGSLAATAGHISESTKWIQSVHDLMTPDINSIRYTSVSAQLLAVMLKNSAVSPKAVEISTAVVSGLEGTVKGEMSELEQLTLDLNTLRRRALRYLSTTRQPSNTILIDNLEALCLQFPRFSARWLGKPPGEDAQPKDTLRFEQRRQLLVGHADSIVDGCIMILKRRLDAGTQEWSALNSTLQYCLDFLQRMGDFPSQAQNEGIMSNQYIKISGLYFLYASKTRGVKDKTEQANGLKALRRSIEAMNGRPANEKEKAKYTAKLEKLAESYKHFGHASEARSILSKLCHNLAEAGVLADVALLLEAKSPSVAWNKHGDIIILSRTLIALARLGNTDDSWIDDLPVLEQAALLEHRLHISSGTMKNSWAMIQESADKLAQIYQNANCHFRHLRSLVFLYERVFAHGEDCTDISAQVLEAKQQLDSKGYGQDDKLSPYFDETWAYYKSIEMLRSPEAKLENFSEAIRGWRAAVSSAMSQSGSLEDVMSNPETLLRHLGAIREYATMKGESEILAHVLELSRDICISMASSPGNVLLYESMLGTHFLDVGDHAKAASIFSRKESQLDEDEGGPKDGHVAYYLASANYDMQRGDLEQAQINLDEARRIFEANKSCISTTTRVKFTSEASHLYSVLALNRGDSAQALEYARTSVKIIYQLWSRFEQFKTEDVSSSPTPDSSNSTDELGSRVQGHGAEFWGLTSPMMRYLQRASAVYMYLGSFADTQYYAEQAYRVASSTGSLRYQAQAACWAASILVKGDNLADAENYITIVKSYLGSVEPCVNSVSLACQLASIFRSMNYAEDEVAMLELANAHMSSIGVLGEGESAETELAGRMQELEIKEPPKSDKKISTRTRSTTVAASTRSTRAKTITSTSTAASSHARTRSTVSKKPTTTATRRGRADTAPTKKPITEATQDAQIARPSSPLVSHMLKTKTSLILSQGLALINQKDYVGAYEILQEAGQVMLEATSSMERDVACAMCLVGRALEKMIRDPVFSVVQDSTLSFPAVCNANTKVAADNGSVDMEPGEKPKSGAKEASETKDHVARQGRGKRFATTGPSFTDDLREAQQLLVKANSVAAVCGDAGLVYRVSSLLQTTLIFLSATTADSNVVAHPSYASSTVEYARNVVWKREREASTCSFSLLTEWPPVLEDSTSQQNKAVEGYGDIARFQQDYVDILPPEWSAISLALSENKSDLCITKLQAGHTPFMLRLPLERATSREMDVDVFNFSQGHAELLEIVSQSNESCHSAKKMVDKESRAEWRRQREEIDERLESLLANIEHLWLGGFRGIFSQHRRRTDLLAKFQQSFQDTLDKHLPSRRRIRGRKAPSKITLDPRILDLFVGLGDPADHSNSESQLYDIDEALTDLLYFVVDILQFHGERNAYDEIDFDAMIIDTMDALKSYHHAVATQKRLDIPKSSHTILVVDKDLIPFPWESLPCMENQAVSRVPSLDYLRHAILEQRSTSHITPHTAVSSDSESEVHGSRNAKTRPAGHHVQRSSGTWMLNPGGDLTNTQARFEDAIQALPSSWSRIVTTTPTESTFENALANSDILVYMGHGSGAQYIRSKTVRKMDKLRSTALLIGCSSARLTPAGAFEHYGTPRNYLLAGCPAVVGMLWDVTDREIDRYAAALMQNWGLLPHGTFDEGFFYDSHAKSPRRQYRDRGLVDGEMSLVEAVMTARSACTFRYLTAAAVVVYGIPVYIAKE